MSRMAFETIVKRPLAVVWQRFQDVEASLTSLSPPDAGVIIESAGPLPPRLGTEVRISAKTPIGRKIWIARYVEFVPPHAVAFGAEARFVDEQIAGPFKRWRHEHEFEAIDDRTTRCVDRVTFTAPYGIVGWLLVPVLVRPAVKKMFAHRARVMGRW